MDGIVGRVGQARDDIPWTENTLDPELVELVETYKERNNPKLSELFRRYPDKEIHIFRTRAEADAWLSAIPRGESNEQ